jgi:hypothetical protein
MNELTGPTSQSELDTKGQQHFDAASDDEREGTGQWGLRNLGKD